MVSKLPESLSPEDPTWLAEVIYRFAFDATHKPLPPDANAARLRLEGGNRAFTELLDRAALSKPAKLSNGVDPHDGGLFHRHSAAPTQQPFAAVVGCADARVPVELIFSEGPNDLFVVSAAGNGLGDDVMGSLSYAVDHLKDSLRTIVVLGIVPLRNRVACVPLRRSGWEPSAGMGGQVRFETAESDRASLSVNNKGGGLQ
jgi:carbonic anhydrase